MPMPVLFVLVAIAIVALSIWSVVKGLRDGEVPHKTFLSFSRADQPALFWTILWSHVVVGAIVAVALGCFGWWTLTR